MNQFVQDPSDQTVAQNAQNAQGTDQAGNDLPKVSTKQKKEEIISAYQELLERFKNNAEKSKSREKDTARKQENTVLSRADQYSTETILKKIGELEMSTHEWLGKLVDALGKEVQRFRELQEAVQIQESRLKEIHQIDVEANTLSDIIEAQKEKTREFEEEMTEKKRDWEIEQKDFEYTRNSQRRKEEDEYHEKQTAKIAELKEWEDRLKATAAELEDLRRFKGRAEEDLADAVEKAKMETTALIEREEEIKAQLLAEKNNSEKQITEHTIRYLKDHLSDLENSVTRLKAELEIANQGVKDIAIKVIEGGRVDDQHRSLKFAQKEKLGVEELV